MYTRTVAARLPVSFVLEATIYQECILVAGALYLEFVGVFKLRMRNVSSLVVEKLMNNTIANDLS